VNVHVPKSGEQEFAASIDDSGGFIDFDFSGGTERGYAAAGNDDGLIRLWRAAGSVDDRDMLKYERNIHGSRGYVGTK
jgi:hypothetical protein